MSKSPLTIGHDRITGEPLVVKPEWFAVVITASGSIGTYGAPDFVTRLQVNGRPESDKLAEAVARRVVETLGGSGGGLPEHRFLTTAEAATVVGLTTANEPPILVCYREAARLLGVTVEALAQRVSRGQIPHSCIRRTGRRVQFVRSKLGEMKSAPSRRTA